MHNNQAVAASVEELIPATSINAKAELNNESYGMVGVVVLVVVGLHVGLLMQAFSTPESKLETVPSAVISGVLITLPQQSEPQPKQVSKETAPKPIPPPTGLRKPVEIAKPETTLPPTAKVEPVQEVVPLEEMNEAPVNKPEPQPVQAETESVTEMESALLQSVVSPRSDAKQLNNAAPVYPRTALRLGQTGTVILNLLVRADGSVEQVTVKTSSGYSRLDKAAVKAVKRWRYLPASQGGQVIDFWYEQPIVFSLRK